MKMLGEILKCMKVVVTCYCGSDINAVLGNEVIKCEHCGKVYDANNSKTWERPKQNFLKIAPYNAKF